VIDDYPWKITPQKVQQVIDRIVEISRPKRLILFGSYVRGETNINSDLDVLVVVDQDLPSYRDESVRIRRALRGISMPMDILVASEKKFRELSQIEGLVYHEILTNGEVVYQAA
jgi:uncharacterized protein